MAGAAFVTSLSWGTTVRWELRNVTFDDEGAANGWFYVDLDTNSITHYSIFTTAGTGPVGAHVYTPTTGGGRRQTALQASTQENFFYNLADRFDLRLAPVTELDGAGGSHDLDLSAPNDNLECNNCLTVRLITAGQLVGFTDDLFGDGFD